MNKNLKIYFLLFFLSFSLSAFSQFGTIRGTIKDSKNNEAVIGATISIPGTTIGAIADVEGNFEIPKVAAGTYTIKISFIGYKNTELKDIKVFGGQTTLINSSLVEDSQSLQEIKVVARRFTFSDVSVITEIKQAEAVAVGISAEQIGKTQDRDAAQVIRRVPGISIFDDRFVVVRGLNERYNTVMLNDAISPSTEVDTRAFSFDLIPSGAIDRMIVYKSPSAELPGDFSGGVIKLFTKTVPDANKFEVGFSLGTRALTTGAKVNDYSGGKFDWLGFDDGTRRLPSSFPTTNQIQSQPNSAANVDAFKNLNPFYTLQQKTVSPDLRFSLLWTRKMKIGSKDLNTYTSANYSNTNNAFQNQDLVFKRYEADVFADQLPNDFKDRVFQNNVRIGIMSNWSYIINAKNKIEFRNLFNQLANKETNYRNGSTDSFADLTAYSFKFDTRSIYSGQLSGKHDINDNSEFGWNAGFGFTKRYEPDTRRFIVGRSTLDEPFAINVPRLSSPVLEQASRFFSDLSETVTMASGNYEYRIEKGEDKEPVKLKAGFYTELKNRDFGARWFGFVNPFRVSTQLSPEEFFAPSNLSTNGLYVNEGTNYDDKYTARNLNASAFASAVLPMGKFKATAGVRGEYNDQSLESKRRGSGNPIEVGLSKFNVLPSVNVSYNFTEKSLLRAAWGMTLNRPEFRELAPFTYYDFNLNASKTGNPDLKNASVNNFDLRYEFYPTQSELISLGVFYKDFKNPIEQVIRYSGSGVNFSYANASRAYSRGIELELRKNLTDLTSSKFINNLSFLLNTSLIQSNVKSSGGGSGFGERQLQGQSPYIINGGVFYNDADHKFQVNVVYNIIGQRIVYVGDKNKSNLNGLYPDQYEIPRNMLDINVIKGIGQRLEIKAGVQDLLNNVFGIYQDTNLDGKISRKHTAGEDDLIQSFRRGAYYSVGVTYKF
ncbi:TonB-dependent receptor [Emticicia sp. CRIBPO]|uniref:TonB-dependent receptor n=1 Tax=Emticicia sp. CRIBPO TaxID=2683258 RepID=UPI001412A777|nr:TonB-dependent receptor [Emticicia sp. CRIBPO]NBA84440.1 TonB-dependent receptor [Emticicia sp. CRIBPO]